MIERWNKLKARYGEIVERYGTVAVSTYLVLFAGTLFGFWVAIRLGFEPSGVAAGAGTVGAAWFATKLTQPIRIGVTIVLTPIVATLLDRLRRPRLPSSE